MTPPPSINTGKFHYAEGKYSEVIKMYQMALDQIPQEEKKGFKVCCNIGDAFINIKKYCNAIQNHEATRSSSPDHHTGTNALLCYVVLEDADKVSGVLPKLCHCN